MHEYASTSCVDSIAPARREPHPIRQTLLYALTVQLFELSVQYRHANFNTKLSF